MDFTYSEEQRMLADSLRRLVQDEWDQPRRRARAARAALDRVAWRRLAELGVLGLNVAADYGGFGEPAASLLPVHLELGRGLVSEPVIASAVMGGALVAACAPEPARRSLLPPIASGALLVSVAWQEPGRRYAVEPHACRVARGQNGGWRLWGAKHLVWHGAVADGWLVTARDDSRGADSARAAGGTGEAVVLYVPADTPGATVLDTPTLDRARCARIDFDNVELPEDAVLARGDAALSGLAQALDWGAAAQCAHTAGAMERLLEITADYLRTRRQFGQPLAAFQALQHRVADMLVAKEMALSMAYVAAAALDETDTVQRRRMLAAAKLEVARAARLVGQCAVQLHGGMGMTDELEVGDYFKRLAVTGLLFGDSIEQLSVLETLAA
jgi:alkylation response protein AidB-like acyl-CoA dehydrogenase